MMFRDSDGFIHESAGVFNSENAIEFSILYNFLMKDLKSELITRLAAEKFDINAHRNSIHTKFKMSHDNFTAMLAYDPKYCDSMSKRLGSNHPRDFAYSNIIKGKNVLISKMILSPILIFSCSKHYERAITGSTGNKYRDILKINIMKALPFQFTFKGFTNDQVESTSRKLLCWLRFKAIDMPLTQRICEYYIRKHFGNWKNVFRTYFRNDESPLNEFEVDRYEI